MAEIDCEVILDPEAAAEWLKERGVSPPPPGENNMPTTILLNEPIDGQATATFAWEGPAARYGDPACAAVDVSLALLENVVEAMRAAAGPDKRQGVAADLAAD